LAVLTRTHCAVADYRGFSPLLRRTLSLQMHEPLREPIAVQYDLEGLSREELDAYLTNQLKGAGVTQPLLDDTARQSPSRHQRDFAQGQQAGHDRPAVGVGPQTIEPTRPVGSPNLIGQSACTANFASLFLRGAGRKPHSPLLSGSVRAAFCSSEAPRQGHYAI
jgi:hypothetical protein